MGLFSRSNPTHGSEADVMRMRGLFRAHFGGDPPEIMEQLALVASNAGVRLEDLDHVEALTALYTGFNNLTAYAAKTVVVPGLAEAVDAYFDSADFSEDGLWNTIFSFGPRGVAVAKFMSEQCVSGVLAGAAADRLTAAGPVATTFAQLPNPQLDEADPKQTTFKLMSEMGFYVVVFGVGSANALVNAVLGVAPQLGRSDASGAFGTLGDWGLWSVWTTSHASAFALFMSWDGGSEEERLALEIAESLRAVQAPWEFANGRRDAWLPEAVVPILRDGQIVYASTLDAFSGGEEREHRERLRAIVEVAGFELVGGMLYKGTFPVSGGRTQLLWVAFDDQFTLLSPIAEGVGEEIPARLASSDFGRYTIAALPPFAVLQLPLAYTVSEAEFHSEALEITRYADTWEQQLTPGRDEL